MVSYRLIQRILNVMKETQEKEHLFSLNEDDFVFLHDIFNNPSWLRAELRELEQRGYIYYTDRKCFVPSHRAYYWKREIALSVLRYIGLSVLTPILVTLATLWVSGQL